MNSYDRAALFSLGYAFRRRFAFIELPSPYSNDENIEYTDDSQDQWIEINNYTKAFSSVSKEIERWIENQIDIESRSIASKSSELEDNLSELWDQLQNEDWNPAKLVNSLVGWITNNQMVDMGYAQTVDSIKFLLIYLHYEELSFINSKKAVDEAFLAYVVPQLEYFLPKIRRETITTIGEEKPELKKIKDLHEKLLGLGLVKSANKIQKVTKKVVESGDSSMF